MRCLVCLFLFFQVCNVASQEVEFKEKLRAFVSLDSTYLEETLGGLSSNDDQVSAESHYLLGIFYSGLNQSDTASHFFGESAGKFRKIGQDSMYIQSLMSKARAEYNQGDMISNEKIYLKALDHFETYENDPLKVSVLLGLGWAYREQANHAAALDKYLEAKRLAQRLDDQDLLSNCYSKIAVVYHVKKDYPTAKINYEKSLEISQALNDSGAIQSLFNNMGLLYYYQDKMDSALYYYNMSKDLAALRNKIRGVAIANENIGLVLNEQGKHQEALENFRQSLSVWQDLNDNYGIGQVMAYQFHAYNDLGWHDSTIFHSVVALRNAKIAGTRHVERDIYEYLHLSNAAVGNFEESYHYLQKFVHLRDSLDEINQDQEMAKLEMKHRYAEKYYQDSILTEKRETELQLQAERDEIAAKEAVREAQTTRNYFLIGLVAAVIILILILYVMRQKQKTSKQVSLQNVILHEKNKEITDSINYAQRIQSAILPSDDYLRQILPKHFIWYHPKDIVAGDFYWAEKIGNRIYLAVADCTGHGVPGAMVSVVCSNALNKVVLEEKKSDPSRILERTTEVVVERFGKHEKDIKDGMDIALLVIDESAGQIEFAGANNSLILIDSEGLLHTLKGARRCVGQNTLEVPFETHVMPVSGKEKVYMFTDGYPDQFGGQESRKGKKFKVSRLKQLLLKIHSKELYLQKTQLKENFIDWQGDFEQVDDVCVVGVEL